MQRRQKAAYAKYGEIFRLKLIRSYVMSTSDPKIFQKIARNRLTKSTDYGLLYSIIGDGLVTSSGNLWQTHRRAIQPAFNVCSLQKYVEIFDRKTIAMVDELKNHCDGAKIDFDKFATPLSAAIIMEALMGIEKSNESKKSSDFAQTVAR